MENMNPKQTLQVIGLVLSVTFVTQSLRAGAPAGQVVAWGNGTNNTGVYPNLGQAIVPAGLNDAIAIGGGGFQSLAVKSDGTVIVWGSSAAGPLPPPAGLSNVVAVTAGKFHCLALKNDGTVVAWGMGPNSTIQTNLPSGLTNVIAITTGEDPDTTHNLALKRDGTVVAWGNSPTDIPAGVSNVVAIAASPWFNVVVKNDSTVFAWGSNYFGETTVPPGLSNVVAVAAGEFHALALKNDGTVVSWGDYDQTTVPVGLSNVVAIAAGGGQSLALTSDGHVVEWGSDYTGPISAPDGLGNVVAIAAGLYHSLAIVNDLKITSIQSSNQSQIIGFHTFVNQHYSMEYSPSLAPGSWNPLPGGNIQGDGSDVQITDANVIANGASRFYRLKLLP